MAKKKEAISVYGEKLHFKDGTPVTAEMFENEPSDAAVKRMEAISDEEFAEEDRILDELLEHPERADELKDKGGLKYPKD